MLPKTWELKPKRKLIHQEKKRKNREPQLLSSEIYRDSSSEEDEVASDIENGRDSWQDSYSPKAAQETTLKHLLELKSHRGILITQNRQEPCAWEIKIYLNHVASERHTTNEGGKLNFELKRQISINLKKERQALRHIMCLKQTSSFLKGKLQQSLAKPDKDNCLSFRCNQMQGHVTRRAIIFTKQPGLALKLLNASNRPS